MRGIGLITVLQLLSRNVDVDTGDDVSTADGDVALATGHTHRRLRTRTQLETITIRRALRRRLGQKTIDTTVVRADRALRLLALPERRQVSQDVFRLHVQPGVTPETAVRVHGRVVAVRVYGIDGRVTVVADATSSGVRRSNERGAV